MQSSTLNIVQSLSATGASRVHVGNTYNTVHNYPSESDQVRALSSNDPRSDKSRIEDTKGGLLKESYMWILETPEFRAWLSDDPESRLLWIKGDPGKGKTMLLCGIIDHLLPSSKLENPESQIALSYFFCQATEPDLRNSTAVLQGLIYLLVTQNPCLMSHLKDGKRMDATHRNFMKDTRDLFRKIVADPALQETYLIVDALDECLEGLGFLLEIISDTTTYVKWIVSSRHDWRIEENFRNSSTLGLSLELNDKSVSEAVKYFIDYRTRQLVDRKRLKRNVAQEVYNHLKQHAHGTFLWVAFFPEGLREFYAQMVDRIRASDISERNLRLLAVASTVFRPLFFSEVIAMEQLDLDEETLPNVIWDCGSFLTTQEKTIVFVHQSAKDFLLKESSAFLFPSGLVQHHYDLFQRSVCVLKSLHKDMYHLVYPGVSLELAIRNRPSHDPLSGLVYAVQFWADHVREAHHLSVLYGTGKGIPFAEIVYSFLSGKFLFWLEALSLCQSIPIAGKALSFLKDLPTIMSKPVVIDLIEDALRFLLLFNPVIENYPLQVYASGLLFSPRKSLVRNMFEQYTPGFLSRQPLVDDTWSSVLSVFETPPGTRISNMSVSTISDMLVITTSDSHLLIWNASDGSMHKRRKYDNATLLTISPDLQWLAIITVRYSGDTEKHVQDTLEVHDLDSNKTLWTETLDSQQVLAMRISPDSQWLACDFPEEEFMDIDEGGGDVCGIYDTKFVPNTHLVMICDTDDMSIHLWDYQKGECKVCYNILQGGDAVMSRSANCAGTS
ncbi:hypothetical protein FLONG3_4494 [Fusarium longipes]|uniref:NACHT domain-containing protein n=1 Tax=Fusarium longipes TaxID=694270 RepID=A0A395SYS6_9HYPO|nr:hypothetical protein FLONG3_4494 [Fusarium longipes]